MNKFLNRKKTDEGISTNADALTYPSPLSPTSPGLKKSATSRWKKSKKQLPEPKPELNISAALPKSDDFRTSLLMPNLSARFSMLREQDDPNSLLGKASDDSVLQPRRRSRMMDFGFGSGNLNDIAEVQSINSSIRPPFAYARQDSYGSEDGYGSGDDSHGSVLSRARPGEGNNLFGGRQKVYKIPMGGASSTKLGKAVYEDDIGMSAFQRYRKEREAVENWQSEDDPSFDFGLDQTDGGYQDDVHASNPNDSAKDLSHSPSLSSYDKKRSTTSSTARSEARSSTAATSVASQPAASAPSPLVLASQQPLAREPSTTGLKRSDTQKRRLYEQGLDQHMHDQQASAMTRLNSIQRQRSHKVQSPPFLYSAKSASNISEMKSQPVYALRAQSPPPLTPLTTFGSIRKPSSGNGSPMTSGPQSPISPAMEFFPELNQALEPGDRGKATAMGAFNKPKQQFDEAQYLERQQQLQRSQSKGGPRKDSASQSAVHQRLARFEQAERERSASNSSIHQRIGRIEQADRERSGSNASNYSARSTRSRSRSAPRRHEPTKAYNVFQNAANQIPTKAGAQQYDTHRTFFGNISASDSEEEEDYERNEHGYGQSGFGYGGQAGRWQPAGLPSVSEHPALRGHASKPSLAEEDEEDLEPKPLRPTPSSRSLRDDAFAADSGFVPDVDSPTLGPSTTDALNGMVHHLRQKSNQSSIYPDDQPADDVPDIPEMPWNAKNGVRNTVDSQSRVESTYTNSNPWDLDDIDNAYNINGDGWERSSVSPVEGMQTQGQSASRAPSRQGLQRHSEVSQDSEGASGSPWQQELRKQHNRDASTATQQERDAFANELAARRTAIQENMKSIVESQSRGVSPAPSASGAFKAFGMLRSKSSRESVDISKREPSAPTKALKMLGIGANASSNTLNSQYERNGFSFDVTRARNNSASKAPPMPNSQTRGPLNDWEQSRARGDSESSTYNRRSPASSQASRARSRSNSEATTGRSRSRTGPYRDDLDKAMAEGMGSSAAGHPDLSQLVPRELTPRPSPEAVQSQFDGQPRTRSNSRAGVVTNYFDAKNIQHIQTGRLAPNGQSPITLSPNVYSPAGASTRPSPAVSPIAQNPTPPLSGANTPVGATFTPPTHMPTIQARQGLLRKRTVSKNSISEPRLISSTSNVDTVDLPEGASLKNGMDEAPPVPPINPRRRGARKMFGLGRGGMSDDAYNYGNFGRSKTPDPWMSRTTTEPDFQSVKGPRGFEGRPGVRPSFENHSSPAIQQYALSNGPVSPERIERSPLPRSHTPVEGGMF